MTRHDFGCGSNYASSVLQTAHRRGQIVCVGWGLYDLRHHQERVRMPVRAMVARRVAALGAWADRATASEIAAWLGVTRRAVTDAIGSDRSRGVR